MAKRNDYFSSYGVPVVTFTDFALEDMDACFGVMESIFRPGRHSRSSLQLS